jgi:hypothetical protein
MKKLLSILFIIPVFVIGQTVHKVNKELYDYNKTILCDKCHKVFCSVNDLCLDKNCVDKKYTKISNYKIGEIYIDTIPCCFDWQIKSLKLINGDSHKYFDIKNLVNDTVGIKSDATGYTTTPYSTLFEYYTLDTSKSIITPKYDTIPISLMISDSDARYMYLGDTIGVDVSHAVYYVKAYSVREQKIRSHIYNTIGLQTMEEYMEHQYYLTEDKKPIPKGWVVWLSK